MLLYTSFSAIFGNTRVWVLVCGELVNPCVGLSIIVLVWMSTELHGSSFLFLFFSLIQYEYIGYLPVCLRSFVGLSIYFTFQDIGAYACVDA